MSDSPSLNSDDIRKILEQIPEPERSIIEKVLNSNQNISGNLDRSRSRGGIHFDGSQTGDQKFGDVSAGNIIKNYINIITPSVDNKIIDSISEYLNPQEETELAIRLLKLAKPEKTKKIEELWAASAAVEWSGQTLEQTLNEAWKECFPKRPFPTDGNDNLMLSIITALEMESLNNPDKKDPLRRFVNSLFYYYSTNLLSPNHDILDILRPWCSTKQSDEQPKLGHGSLVTAIEPSQNDPGLYNFRLWSWPNGLDPVVLDMSPEPITQDMFAKAFSDMYHKNYDKIAVLAANMMVEFFLPFNPCDQFHLITHAIHNWDLEERSRCDYSAYYECKDCALNGDCRKPLYIHHPVIIRLLNRATPPKTNESAITKKERWKNRWNELKDNKLEIYVLDFYEKHKEMLSKVSNNENCHVLFSLVEHHLDKKVMMLIVKTISDQGLPIGIWFGDDVEKLEGKHYDYIHGLRELIYNLIRNDPTKILELPKYIKPIEGESCRPILLYDNPYRIPPFDAGYSPPINQERPSK